MNNQSPLIPQGSALDPKNKGRARVKIAVFFVLAIHGVGLLALLLQGCHKEDASTQAAQATNAAPAFEATNLPVVAETNAPPGPSAPQTAEATNPAPATATEYTVAKGDIYSTIAKKFGVSVLALKEANPGVEPTKLQIGKKLHIPAPTKTVAAAAGATSSPEPNNSEPVYTVKSGDNLLKIASEHHTSVRAIRAANNLRSDRITVGQKLKIPAKGSGAAPTETASTNPTVPAGSATSH